MTVQIDSLLSMVIFGTFVSMLVVLIIYQGVWRAIDRANVEKEKREKERIEEEKKFRYGTRK